MSVSKRAQTPRDGVGFAEGDRTVGWGLMIGGEVREEPWGRGGWARSAGEREGRSGEGREGSESNRRRFVPEKE